MADDGELVESGTFRVDRKKALEKLKEFQLPDPAMFLLPWVRCAVASDAIAIDIHENNSKDVLEVRFDGRPFTEIELRKLYDYLFEEETPETARNRQLAIGLLTVLRLKPECVTITSGASAERVCLKIESLKSESMQTPEEGPGGTILRVDFTGFRLKGPSFDLLRRHVNDRYRMGTVPLTHSGYWYFPPMVDVPYHMVEKPKHSFTAGDVLGWVEAPQNLFENQSQVRLHTFGVFVETVEVKPSVAPVEMWLNDDRLTLNVSQSGVVQNTRLQETLELVNTQAEAFLLDVLGKHGENLAAVGRILHHAMGGKGGEKALDRFLYGAYSDYWRSYLDGSFLGGKHSMVFDNRISFDGAKMVQKLFGTAHITVWLREACKQKLQDLDKDMANPTLKALWEAPVFFGLDGTPLGLAELELPRRQLGHVPFSTGPHFGSSVPRKAVWCIAKQDRADLEKFFPDQCEDVTDKLG